MLASAAAANRPLYIAEMTACMRAFGATGLVSITMGTVTTTVTMAITSGGPSERQVSGRFAVCCIDGSSVCAEIGDTAVMVFTMVFAIRSVAFGGAIVTLTWNALAAVLGEHGAGAEPGKPLCSRRRRPAPGAGGAGGGAGGGGDRGISGQVALLSFTDPGTTPN